MHSTHMPLGIGGREGSWLVAWSLFLLLFLAIHVVYFMGLYVGMCVRVLCCIYVTSCNVMWVCLASTGWTSPDGFQTYCTRKLLRQALELIITHHVTVTLFSFSFFFLFFSPQVSVLAVGDVWKVVLKGMSARVGCCSSAGPTFILDHPLGCDYKPDVLACCLVTVCLTGNKQDQYCSLVMFIFVGENWSWLQRPAVSIY